MTEMTTGWRIAAIAVGTLAMASAPLSATAEPAKVVAGTLTCKGAGTVGLIVGSKEQLSCTFKPAGKVAVRRFSGSTTRVGLDVGVRGKSTMIWTVLGSTTQLPSEHLGGSFGGVSADVAAGLGVGANVLVGGNKKSVVLQPLSVKGQTGLNVAVGVSSLTLKPLP